MAYHLLDIFCTFGAPSVLQNDNGREFTSALIEECTTHVHVAATQDCARETSALVSGSCINVSRDRLGPNDGERRLYLECDLRLGCMQGRRHRFSSGLPDPEWGSRS